MIRPFAAFVLAASFISVATAAPTETSGSAIVREMNLARQNPALYATYLEQLRASFQGNLLVLLGRTAMRTTEGTRAVEEAIQSLRKAAPQARLACWPRMSHAAAAT